MRGPRRPGGGRRAQLLLAGALILALTLVGLGIVLDSVVHSQTVVATHDADVEGAALEYRSAVTEGLGGALFYANYYADGGYGTLESGVADAHDRWVREASAHYTVDGVAAEARLTDTERGSLLYQGTVGPFTDAEGATDWRLVGEAEGVRRFRMDVRTSSLADLSAPDDPDDLVDGGAFHVRAESADGSDQRTVYLYDDGDPTVAVTADGSLVDTCSGSGSSTAVDLTAGTVGGTVCDPLAFPGGMDTFDLSYEAGDAVEGRYTLVVDQRYGDLPDDSYTPPRGSDSPHAVRALFAATTRVAHRGPDVRYRVDLTVTPESTPRGPVYDYPTEAPCTGPLVFTDLSGGLHTIASDGTVTDYAPDSVQAIGPMEADVDGDGRDEIPYVNAANELRTVDAAGSGRLLGPEAVGSKTLLAVGTWGNDAFADRTAVYYLHSEDSDIWRAWYDPGTGTVQRQEIREKDGDGDGISAVVGVRDYNGDGDTDIVFADGSAQITYVDGGTTHETPENVGVNNGVGAGEPCDFDGDGDRRAPIVDGSANVALLPPDGTSEDLTSSGPAAKAPLAAAEWDASASGIEVVFVGSGETLHYVTQDGTVVQVTDADGDPVAVDDDQGVA